MCPENRTGSDREAPVIAVVGHTAIDHLFTVPALPERHSSTYITGHRIFFGGGAANIAAGIATLGGRARLVSAVGGDFAGSDYDRRMGDLGIVRDFFLVEEAFTPTAYIFTDDAGDQVTYFEWGASSVFAGADAPALDFVHMATADPDFNVRVAEKSRFASFDPGQDLLRYSRSQLESILSHVDLLFANRHEVAGMCEILGIRQEELIAGVPVAVFTMDSRGSMLHMDGTEEFIPAAPVRAVDPTGAGDAYRAGFLTAYLMGYAPPDCCRVGTITASFVVEKIGCQTNLPDWNRMLERYQQVFGALVKGA